MAIETRIIQVRRGEEAELDKSKFLPGEFGSATDTKKIFHAFAPNVVKELAFKDDIKVTAENIKTALGYVPADEEDVNELNEKLVQEISKLSNYIAGNLQNGIDAANERVILLETMVLNNEFAAPMITDDDSLTVITDDNGNAILADWKHKEV